MNDREIRRHQMLTRVRNFGTTHSTDFPATNLGGQLFTTIAGVVTELDNHATAQTSASGAARQGTSSKATARAALRDRLEEINRTARALAMDTPGLDDQFRMPRGTNDQLLLNSARAFAQDAVAHSTAFTEHELPATFIADLNAEIANLETAIDEQLSSKSERVAATAAIDNALEEGMKALRKLDVIVRNKFRNSPAVVAEWISASHTERAPRHAPAAPTPAPKPPA
jgi:hypothetical protein